MIWLWYNSPTMSNNTGANDRGANDRGANELGSHDLELVAALAHRRQLTTPLLLMLASHRPLTFVTGQLLYALAPFGALLGWEGASDWAAILSAPDANQRLATMLTTSPIDTSTEVAESIQTTRIQTIKTQTKKHGK